LFSFASMFCLFLDSVEPLEHVIDILEVIGAGSNGGDIARWLEVLLEMSLVAELAHLVHKS
jgi:hypothetical protein